MSPHEPEGVVSELTRLANSNRIANVLPLTYGEHWSSAGDLEMSSRSMELRTRFLCDGRWNCGECRPSKEAKEGNRLLQAFLDYEMWIAVAPVADRHSLARSAKRAGLNFVALPVHGGRIVMLTTGRLFHRHLRSELVESRTSFVPEVLMKLRWVGALSSSRGGFLPPARKAPGWFETYHPGTNRRCWHLHESDNEAGFCRDVMKSLDGTSTGWYIRPASAWRRVGRLKASGEQLRSIADHLHIKTAVDTTTELGLLVLEPMTWDDGRFRELRDRAGWQPPSDNFQPPPLDLEVTVRIRDGVAAI